MKTIYAACLARLGLSQSEAAELHEVRLDRVKKWCTGISYVPDGVWAQLRDREAKISRNATAIAEIWEEAGRAPLGIASVADSTGLLGLASFVLNSDQSPTALITPERL